jgi:hypothetical protein
MARHLVPQQTTSSLNDKNQSLAIAQWVEAWWAEEKKDKLQKKKIE